MCAKKRQRLREWKGGEGDDRAQDRTLTSALSDSDKRATRMGAEGFTQALDNPGKVQKSEPGLTLLCSEVSRDTLRINL